VPDRDPDVALPGGYPILATFGDQGPAVCGWLSRYQPEIVTALHLLEGLIRVPQALAAVLLAAGPGALAQVGRILAARPAD
jgi:hypothetical protein